MRVEIVFPGEMEADVLVSETRRGQSRPDSINVAPYFYQSDGRVPVMYLLNYDKEDNLIAKYVLVQAGSTGKLHLLDRTSPVLTRYERLRYGEGEEDVSDGLGEEEDED